MTDRERFNAARRETQRQNRNPRACPECFGDVWGLATGYLPHDPQCWRLQDEETRTLRRLGAPLPVHDDTGHDDTGAEYEPRTVFPGRSWWEPETYDIGGGR